ncbi:hypothetical protein [Chroococcus sp. FPU101]|uniref:hypothetical protein n=1 Tax=Chroococcus sp. FPU101 TaxID=1974212 RepID=UPI001A8FD12F|nr:hypothetical protein [Chroococcus sp. FPU101]GFE69974.1 hypothetical protein CFPU101_25840 [Chroococcus sp. FPU101]
MLWYNNRPLWRFMVLFLLIPAIYSVFGWTIALESEDWRQWLTQEILLQQPNLVLSDRILNQLLYGLALVIILGTTFGLTIWDKTVIGLLGSCFKSDFTALVAVLIWSLTLALIICFINYFAELMLLLGGAILGRLELQEASYNNWQICSILTAICVCSFAIGLLGFDWWQYTMTTI